jgi:hypothetical protein
LSLSLCLFLYRLSFLKTSSADKKTPLENPNL